MATISQKSTQPLVKLTDAAVTHINDVISKRGGGLGFRIAVKETGCVGYMYKPEIVDQQQPDDVTIETPQGLTVFVDVASIDFLKDTVIDYVSTGLGQKQLQYMNPNVESECGCGESFSLKKT